MQKPYFIWIALHIMVWLGAMNVYRENLADEYWRLIGFSIFLASFFLLPLFANKPKVSTALICLNAVLSILSVFPLEQETFNPYLLLMVSLLVGEMTHRLPLPKWIFPSIIMAAGIGWFAANARLPFAYNLFIALYTVMLFGAAVRYKLTHDRGHSAALRYDALLTEYKRLKRRLASEEEAARQEERMLIGHEIHDSVGHKLTALLMQLEAFRLKEGGQNQEQVLALKKLAHDSLEETRRAVKTLKQEETGGLQGIMRLIRNLETDSFLRIHFTVNHGAFSAPLNGEQSFVIYRSVQEALTNIMKHSKAREAKVTFEAPGGSLFRFEISNPVTGNIAFQEGFGLRSMRERLQKIGGDLELYTNAEHFVVSGWVRTSGKGEGRDQGAIG